MQYLSPTPAFWAERFFSEYLGLSIPLNSPFPSEEAWRMWLASLGKLSSLQSSALPHHHSWPGNDPDKDAVLFYLPSSRLCLSPVDLTHTGWGALSSSPLPAQVRALCFSPASFVRDIFTMSLDFLFLNVFRSQAGQRGTFNWGPPQKLELPIRKSTVTPSLSV